MQRTGTLRYVGPPRPAPLHHRPAWGNSSKEPGSQANRGPKKQGRSLIAVAGLLRVRSLDPWALVADYSPVADRLARRLDAIAAWLAAHPAAAAGAAGKRESARETAKLLRGKGGRPDILTFLEELPDA